METIEAKRILKQFEEAAFKGRLAMDEAETYKQQTQKLKSDLDEKTKLLKEAKIQIRNLNLLLNVYEAKFGSTYGICQPCNGEGGFPWEGGPGECGFEPCTNCGETGFVELKSLPETTTK